MRSAKLTMAKFLTVLFVACGLQLSASAQENSPYSRYGLGDLTPNHNISTRGMGGVAAGVSNHRNLYLQQVQNINFTNPASLGSIYYTVFDVGTEIDYRILKSTNPAKKFTSANTYVSYLQLAFPLTTPKMRKKDINWGMSFGLRPVSKINYKIEKNERTSIDSLNTIYEGSGGLNQVFLGTGLRIKKFSIGINGGYMFGSKDYSTKLTFINDSTFYYLSNSENKTTFNGLFVNGGIQYEFVLKEGSKDRVPTILRFGLYGNLQQNLNANTDIIRETIFYDPNGGYYRLDSVYEENDVKGKIKLPASIGAGFICQNFNWMYGADFEYGNWASYRYYGQTDQVQNNWTFRAGAQYHPRTLNTPTTKYFRHVLYRAGLYYGSDYININKNRPEYGFTIGTGMQLTPLGQRMNYNGAVILNTALEFGSRGNKQTNLRENIVRFSIGLSMNAPWFQKPKYN